MQDSYMSEIGEHDIPALPKNALNVAAPIN